MRISSLESLRATSDAEEGRFELVAFQREGEHVMEGILHSPKSGQWLPIMRGVPLFLTAALQVDIADFCARHGLPPPSGTAATLSTEENATNATFSEKWARFKQYGMMSQHEEFLFGWYCKKFGLPDQEALIAFYQDRKRVLEVGPGSGFNTKFIARHCNGQVIAVDMSEAAFTTFENTRKLPNCAVVQANLMNMPFEDDFFDFIIADGVLHHTADTRDALRIVYKKLQSGGQMFFYVYRKMGAARQFSDRYMRDYFSKMSPEDCYRACEAITELGRELSRRDVKITLTKPIDVLGIPAGTHDVQRLLYYNFLKCFWNDAFDFETNNMINYDWYHPHYAWQHTEEEVSGWLKELGVADYKFNNANPNGISVLLTKPAM